MVSLKFLVVAALLLVCILELTSARRFRRRFRRHRGRFYRRYYDRLYNYYPDFYDPYYDYPYYDIDLQDEDASVSRDATNPEVDDGKVIVAQKLLPASSADVDLKTANSSVPFNRTDADLDFADLTMDADVEAAKISIRNATETAADLNKEGLSMDADVNPDMLGTNATVTATDPEKKVPSSMQHAMKVSAFQ